MITLVLSNKFVNKIKGNKLTKYLLKYISLTKDKE